MNYLLGERIEITVLYEQETFFSRAGNLGQEKLIILIELSFFLKNDAPNCFFFEKISKKP